MKENSEGTFNNLKSPTENDQELMNLSPDRQRLTSNGAVHSREETVGNGAFLSNTSMNTSLQEHLEKCDSREEEGVTDSLINCIKEVSLEDKIGNSDSMEENSKNCLTSIVSFQSESSNGSTLVKGNHKEDSSINIASKESSVGKFLLKSLGTESKCSMKDVEVNNNFENQPIAVQPINHNSKKDITCEFVQTDNSVQHMLPQSFHHETTLEVLDAVEETVPNKSLENCSEKTAAGRSLQNISKEIISSEVKRDEPHLEEGITETGDSLEGITESSQDQTTPAIRKRKGFRRPKKKANHKEGLEKKTTNSCFQQCAHKETTLQDSLSQKYTCKESVSLGKFADRKIAPSDCLHGKMKSAHIQEHRAKDNLLGSSNSLFEKQMYSYHSSNKKTPLTIGNYKNNGTKEKHIMSRSNTACFSSDKMSREPIGKSVISKIPQSFIDHTSQEAFLIKSKPLEQYTKVSHSLKGRSDTKESCIVPELHMFQNSWPHYQSLFSDVSYAQPSYNGDSISEHAFEFRHTFRSLRMQSSGRGLIRMQSSGRGLSTYHKSFRGWSGLHNSFGSRGLPINSFGNHSAQHSLTQTDNIKHPYRGGYHNLGLPLEHFKVKKENTSGDRIDSENVMQKVENHFAFSEASQGILHNASVNEINATVVPDISPNATHVTVTETKCASLNNQEMPLKYNEIKCINETNVVPSYSFPNVTHVNIINNVKENLETKCVSSFNDQVMPSKYDYIKVRPPWISFYDLSVLLSTLINIYLQSFMLEKVIKDVFSTLYAIIELLEETIKGYVINVKIASAISEDTTNLSIKTSEKLQSRVGIVLLQRKRVTELMEILQEELKSINRYGSYPEHELLASCNGIRRKVLEQIDMVQWLNNDLKFDCHLLQVAPDSRLESKEIMNILKDLETAKECVKSQIRNINSAGGYYRTDSYILVDNNAKFNTQLVKQCFVIKQRLEDLNVCFSKE